MASHLGSPINTALFLYILYSVQRILFPKAKSSGPIPNEFKAGYSWMPKSHPPSVLFKVYTPKTLEPFNGENDGRILLAIDGTVYDVTGGRNFYGPNGMYGNFAGRDASRGMAKQSFDPGEHQVMMPHDNAMLKRGGLADVLTPVDQPLDKLEDLKPDEIDNMKGWIEHFSNKYIICGKLVENDAV